MCVDDLRCVFKRKKERGVAYRTDLVVRAWSCSCKFGRFPRSLTSQVAPQAAEFSSSSSFIRGERGCGNAFACVCVWHWEGVTKQRGRASVDVYDGKLR